MANQISEARRAEMWNAYQERQSVAFVSRKCSIHHRTVDRYRTLDRWDERLEQIRAEAQERADVTLAEAMAESLALVRGYKRRVAQALRAKDVRPSDVTAAELERVIRLEAFVLGGVESRHAVVSDFAAWSDQQLEAFARDGTVPANSSAGSS